MKPAQTQHPDPKQLALFSQGRLPPSQQDEVACHIADCATCCKVLDTLPDDTLSERLRSMSNTAARAAADDVAVPKELAEHARYRVVRMLGAGGMGVVYQAEHRLMERTVALKVIRRSLLAHPTAVERFRTEVRAAARLTHPNIVAALDADQAGDLHFLVMEYIAGESLARIIEERGPLPVAEACGYVCQAAAGLQHAWEQGMVHRDIKPQNLMLTAHGQVKILDFGLARLASQQAVQSPSDSAPPRVARSGSVTDTGALLGTPDYMAPEQTHDSSRIDIRADIYSLGCTLYYLLTGRAPFAGTSVTQKVAAHRTVAPEPLSVLRPDIPQRVVQVVERMMAKDREARYAVPAEVAKALTPWTRPFRSWRWRSRGWKTIGLAAAVLLMLAGGWAWWLAAGVRSKDQRDENHLAASVPKKPSKTGAASTSDATADKREQRTAPAHAGGKRVLLVIPHSDFSRQDYDAIRAAFEQKGARVVVAASSPETATADDASTIAPQVALKDVKGSDFDALVFAGGRGVAEFWGSLPDKTRSPARVEAARLIEQAQAAGKPIASVNMGTAVLAECGALAGKRATGHTHVRTKVEVHGGTWADEPLVCDGQVVTASSPSTAPQLAAQVIQKIQSKNKP